MKEAIQGPEQEGRRRVMVWTPSLDPVLFEALASEGIDIVCQIGGDSGLVRAYSTEQIFSARPEELPWVHHCDREPLPADVLFEYAECIFRLSVIPGTRSMDTSSPGFVFGDNLVDWAHAHASVLKQILALHRPDELWLVDHPHLGLDYLLAYLADRGGIPVLFLMQSRIARKFQAFRWHAGLTREIEVGEFRPYLGGAVAPYVFNQPIAERRWWKPLEKLAFYGFGWAWAGVATWSDRVYNGLIRKDVRGPMLLADLWGQRTRPFAWYRFLRLLRHRRALRQRNFAAASDLQQPFAYFPLHYEPESGPRFESGVWCNQVNAIEAICRLIPSGWKVLVKENPLQPYFARDEPFFLRLQQLPMVRFVADDTPSLELIRAARVVATLNGTAGYEALLEGRPSIHFGMPWYHGLPGTFRFSPSIDIEELLTVPVDRAALDAAMSNLVGRMPDGLVFPRYLEMLEPEHDRAELCRTTARSLRRISESCRAVSR